ncbi:carboxymuconolactone decarboxylase family protein [Caulobacter hibisci]|uniref:Carboxymuconolactone decarboxylase family protein n=1 Tax=Caulobacter hibisci TaxID=2035993 RepID=A0ABS0T0P8_9CAUL|nr:carboxymuconolactone decarboxylase family protein [Caulobacter hibisci]MBI1685442.1 carboxymuconolactone decarboxylase family protein [Caulobacter hibisci]
MSARIAPAQPPWPEAVQASFDRMPRDWMPPFQLFTVLARDPRLYTAFVRGAVTYLPGSHLTIRQREVLLLRVTARCGCAYEWGMRVHYFANEAGLSDAQQHASVHADAEADCWTEDDRVLVRLADQLNDACDVDDALWRDLAERFTPEAILELLMLAGYYRTVGVLANSLRLPLEPGVGRPFPPAQAAST